IRRPATAPCQIEASLPPPACSARRMLLRGPVRGATASISPSEDWMKTSTILASLVAALPVSGCKSNDPEPPKIVQVPVAKAPEAKAAKDVARPVDGRIEIHATREGFEPSKIEVPGGEPLTLVFVRDIEKTCMDG